MWEGGVEGKEEEERRGPGRMGGDDREAGDRDLHRLTLVHKLVYPEMVPHYKHRPNLKTIPP